MKRLGSSLIVTAFLITNLQYSYAQGFVNLNFEQANISGYSPGIIPISAAMPGWAAYHGYVGNPTNVNAAVFYNSISTGGAGVFLEDTNFGSPYTAIQGVYSALLLGSIPAAASSSSIGQIGTIPSTAQSLNFYGILVGSLQITFNGQSINYQVTGSTANYNIYGANISALAGQTGQLLFTAPVNSSALLDNIQFSTSSVPEPNPLTLAALGGLLLGWRRWRKQC